MRASPRTSATLSIHEFATDPETNLAYSAYYAGGIRVFRFSRAGGLEPVGAWIAPGGSNFWGVEQFTADNGERLIAGSDRDFGLVILRYKGPGAVGPKPAAAPPSPAAPGPAAAKPDPRVRLRRRTLVVGKNRRFRVAVNCPATTGKLCVGTLRVESGRTVLIKRRFRVTAGAFRNVSVRLSKSAYRNLQRRKRRSQRVTVSVLTRDAGKTLRSASMRVTLRAKR